MLSHFILTILSGIGLSILFVNKGKQYPIKYFRIIIQKYIHKINYRMSHVFYCNICLSFWTALFSELLLNIFYYFNHNPYYFYWPITGFIACGLLYIINQIIDSLGKQPIININ